MATDAALAAPKHAVHRHHNVVVHAVKKARTAPVARAGSASPLTATVTTAAAAPVSPPPPVPAVCADANLVPTAADLDQIRAATLCLVNQQRVAYGLAALRENAGLDTAAQQHSAEMVTLNYFDHASPTGVDLLGRILAGGYAAGSSLRGAGENIAAASSPLATPAATVAGWMGSSGHRDNILDGSFADTGVGVVAAVPALLGAGSAGATYTQCFGTTG